MVCHHRFHVVCKVNSIIILNKNGYILHSGPNAIGGTVIDCKNSFVVIKVRGYIDVPSCICVRL